MSKKYELLKNDTKEFLGKTLYRVKYLRDSKYFSKGELGGYIEKEENLSQKGDARVCGNARVCGDACVSGDACVYGSAWVSGSVKIKTGDLCSRFNFKNNAQIEKWFELEKQFEQIKNSLKNKPKELEEMNKKELIQRIKELEGEVKE